MTDQVSARESPRAPGAGRSVRPLDGPDRLILRELISDARTSVRSLAARVHISRANAYARVDRLIADGVLDRFARGL